MTRLLTPPTDTAFIRFSFSKGVAVTPTTAAIMGSVLKELKITTGSPITTPLCIGSSPLGEDEYVDYDSGKIYRMVNGVLTPTDPPVPLPALPTVDGTTITGYAGQSVAVPSRFYAKYRKDGF